MVQFTLGCLHPSVISEIIGFSTQDVSCKLMMLNVCVCPVHLCLAGEFVLCNDCRPKGLVTWSGGFVLLFFITCSVWARQYLSVCKHHCVWVCAMSRLFYVMDDVLYMKMVMVTVTSYVSDDVWKASFYRIWVEYRVCFVKVLLFCMRDKWRT